MLDLALLALLTVAAALGAAAGALRQAVQLLAAVLGWLAARHLGAAVGAGLAKWIPAMLSRAAAGAVLFFGVYALVSLVGAALLRGTGLASAVRAPADRAIGALLGGAKTVLVGWVILSAVALASAVLPARAGRALAGSELASLAREHNLLVRLDPGAVSALKRLLEHARELDRKGALASDPDARRALQDPRIAPLAGEGDVDPAAAEKALEDPDVRALIERARARAAERAKAADRAAGLER